jgi:predicted site-specific integrase-resolvase
MKLSEYAKKVGVHYHTAWRWYRSGRIVGYQMETGTIIVTEGDHEPPPQKVAIYARVSSPEMKATLQRQVARLLDYCAAKGWQVSQVVKEIGSGVNDRRPQFLALLEDPSVTMIVIEHPDRATRFGFPYLERLLGLQGRRLEVVNLAGSDQDELREDLVAVIDRFWTQRYGQRRTKQQLEKIIQALEIDSDELSQETA